MKLIFFSNTKLNLSVLVLLALLTTVSAQKPSLSLADILTALRSKKATPAEKNRLLTDAVKERGITFPLTAEIEQELKTTGADNNLVEAIRQKSPIIKVSAAPTPTPAATPTPAPPDYTFFQNRGNANFVKGEPDLAIADYSKAIELNPNDVSTYLSRALAYFSKQSYDLAATDYGKALEISPDAKTYLKRGESYEKLGEIEKAFEDYKKVVEIDANNETAKNSAQRLQLEIDRKIAEQKAQEEKALAAKSVETSQIVQLGEVTSQAISLVKPIYPQLAFKMGAQGKVVVQITIDEQGKVIEAKAIQGNTALRGASEYAARRTTFKPTLANNKPVKAKGTITYNFKPI